MLTLYESTIHFIMAQRKNKKAKKNLLLNQVIEKLKNSLADFSKKPHPKKYDKSLRKAGKMIARTLNLEESGSEKSKPAKKDKKKLPKIQTAS
jgi:hypothetical protein